MVSFLDTENASSTLSIDALAIIKSRSINGKTCNLVGIIKNSAQIMAARFSST